MWRRVAVAVVAVVLVAGGACGREAGGAGQGDGKLRVVASFYPLAEAARRVGGDLVEVTNLTGAGVEPHDVELSPDQVDQLEDADLVLYLGGGFQPAVEDVAERRDGSTVDLLPSGIGDDGHGHEDGGEEHADVHFWLDPRLYAEAVDRIADALGEVDEGEAGAFAENARAFRDELLALDAEAEQRLGTCARKHVVVTHDAFGYLTDRYDLEQQPIAGLSPEAEPNPARLAEVSDLIRREGVTTVFYERLVPASVADTIARETGAKTDVLDPLEGLTRAQEEAGATYVSVMRENVDALARALDCR
ncbi:MAG TPA: zinc ABC transporter substrate-binding protein [Acidimicrobiales bacterium]